MPVRAHRVIKIETARASFNISQETGLMDFIIENIKSKLDESPCGLFNVSVVVLKQAINEKPTMVYEGEESEYINLMDDNYPQFEYANLNLDKCIIESLKEDIAFAEKNGVDYVTYQAY